MKPTLEQLRTIGLLAPCDDGELARWQELTSLRTFNAGDTVVEEGQAADTVYLLFEGTLRNYAMEAGEEVLGHQRAPTWMGTVPVLTNTGFSIRMRALTDGLLGEIDGEDFKAEVLHQPKVHELVMGTVRPVTERMSFRETRREHLASLGTMAAGLAHELNNPASAAKRSAASLSEALDVLGQTIGHFVDAGVSLETARAVVALQREITEGQKQEGRSALDMADAEDDLRDALEDLDVENAWQLAEPLAAGGATADWLARVHETAGEQTGLVLRWVAAMLTANGLADELRESTDRMSQLVGAIKAYSYMDRDDDMAEADIHEGLDTTLMVLKHKLKHTHINLTRDYDKTIPKATIHGSEINQVWTNLIDNAIAAVGDTGSITIKTKLDGNCVEVCVLDDGPGVPDDVLPRIFEPFFTTKEVGQGTGLGLDAARRIVTERHGGSIWAENWSGGAKFFVRLPLKPSAT